MVRFVCGTICEMDCGMTAAKLMRYEVSHAPCAQSPQNQDASLILIIDMLTLRLFTLDGAKRTPFAARAG